MLKCGDTFLIEDEDGPERHLWIVITPPNEGEVVIVSVTTRRKKSETLVVLNKGDHPFLKWESVIAYRFSRVVTVDSIEDAIRNGTAIKDAAASPKLLARAQSGLTESEFTPNGIAELYKLFINSSG
jgi:hypothetical protein